MSEPVSEGPQQSRLPSDRPSDRQGRTRLSRERVLRGAVSVADAGGIGALTIRSLATELGVKPMSVYHHVANKDEILDGIVDIVFSEIEMPKVGGDWRSEVTLRAHSARRVLRLHPWATPLLESRTSPGAGHAGAPRCDARHPACGRLLGGIDRPRLRAARRVRLRVRHPGGLPALPRPGRSCRGRRTDHGTDVGRRLPPSRRAWRRRTTSSPATTSATSSSSGST